MSTSLWVEIRDNSGNPLWSSEEFCGVREFSWLLHYANENDEIDLLNQQYADAIVDAFRELSTEREKDLDRLYSIRESAYIAREHTTTLNDFEDFTDYIDNLNQDIESFCNLPLHIEEMLENALERYEESDNAAELRLIYSY